MSTATGVVVARVRRGTELASDRIVNPGGQERRGVTHGRRGGVGASEDLGSRRRDSVGILPVFLSGPFRSDIPMDHVDGFLLQGCVHRSELDMHGRQGAILSDGGANIEIYSGPTGVSP